jgi:hypothetical protein
MKAKKEKSKKMRPVDESVQICKAREKLKKRMEALEKKMTTQALEKKSLEIHRWIAKNSSERVVLYSKNISLFDENQNTAKVSQRVSTVAEKIQKEMKLLHNLLETSKEKVLE